MSFKQKCKQNFIPGKKITIVQDGLEYSGTVVDADFNNPPDSHVTLVGEDDGMMYLHINNNMVIMVPPGEDDKLEDIVEEKKKTLPGKKKISSKK